MSDKQFEEVEELARTYGLNLRRCPTCGSKPEEPVPGVELGWPTDSTFRYQGEEHTCDCEWQDILRQRYLIAHIPRQYWTLGPGEYYGDPEAWTAAEEYLSNWEGYKKAGLGIEYFSPTQGTGKTFIISWIARQLIQQGERVYYTRFREIMGLYDRPYEVRKEEQDKLLTTPVLVLDEVGKAVSETQLNYFAAEFEDLIRLRTDNNRVTLMTTNLTPEELDRYYPRTYSLLAAKQLRYEIDFEDARRAGDIKWLDIELAKAGESRPIC